MRAMRLPLGWFSLLCFLCFPWFLPAADSKPNILFILIDDMGHGDLSCTGNTEASTPNMDRLAREGLRFTQFHVSSPICSPSRVAFTTGQHPQRWRISSYLNNREANRRRGMADFLDPKAPAIARAFKAAGYATGHFGKWHMGGGRDVGDAPLPQAYGWDESLTSFEGLGDRILPPGNLSKQSEKLGRGSIRWVEKHEQTGIYVDHAIDFLRRHQDQPCYVHLWLDDVHDAHAPRPESLARFTGKGRSEADRKFFAVLEDMDRELGRLFKALDELGLAGNTLILLTSDNGPTAWPSYYKQGIEPPGSTAGDRGRKWSLYEGGIRMPLIARWPGKVPAGKVDDTTVMAAIDFFPSLCQLAHVAPPDGVKFDGEDFSGALLGRPQPRSHPLFWRYDMDLKPGREPDISPPLAIRDGNWKLLMNADGSGVELYDLAADPRESKNLAEARPAVAKRLASKLKDWKEAMP